MAELPPEWRATLLDAMHMLSWNGREARREWSPELGNLWERAADLVGLVLDMAAEEEQAGQRATPADSELPEGISLALLEAEKNALQRALVDAGVMMHMTHGKNPEAWVNCSRAECRSIRDALGEDVARRLSY